MVGCPRPHRGDGPGRNDDVHMDATGRAGTRGCQNEDAARSGRSDLVAVGEHSGDAPSGPGREAPRGRCASVRDREIGQSVCNIKRAWHTAVLKAHGRTPTYGRTMNFSPESRQEEQGDRSALPRSQARGRITLAGGRRFPACDSRLAWPHVDCPNVHVSGRHDPHAARRDAAVRGTAGGIATACNGRRNTAPSTAANGRRASEKGPENRSWPRCDYHVVATPKAGASGSTPAGRTSDVTPAGVLRGL